MSTILDLLNTKDLTDVDLVPPLMKDGSKVTFDILKIELVPSKSDPDETNLQVNLETAHEVPSNKGGTIPARRKFTHTISLKTTSKDGADLTDMVERRVTEFKQAALGTKAGTFMPLEQYLGRQVVGVVSIQKDKTGAFGDQNRIGRFVTQ